MRIEIAVAATVPAVRKMEVETVGKVLLGVIETLLVGRHLTKTLLLALTLSLGCTKTHSSPPAAEVTPPPGMVYVEAGEFFTGSEKLASDPDVGALRKVSIPAFYIDKTEVSNAQVKAVWPEHAYRRGEDDKPATGLPFDKVVEVLALMDKRLPTSLEWEKAARGTDGRIYPWGNDPESEGKAHIGTPKEDKNHGQKGHMCTWGQLVEVTAYPDGASPYGLLNTLGNAWEFVGDEPTESRPYHMIKGGAYGYKPIYNRLDGVSFEQPGQT